jgi:Zn-dependent metalloprotease
MRKKSTHRCGFLAFRIGAALALCCASVFLTAFAFAATRPSPAPVSKATTPAATPIAQQALMSLQSARQAQFVTQVSRETGVYDFVRAKGADVLAADNTKAAPEERGRAFLRANGGLVGMTETERNAVAASSAAGPATAASGLQLANVLTDEIGATHVKFNQTYRGLKVFGAQLIVHMNDRGITGMNGSFIPGISVDTNPAVSAAVATNHALAAVLKSSKSTSGNQLSVTESELAIYRTGLLEGYQGVSVLAYGVKVADQAGPLEQVWISAATGAELMRIPLRHEALNRRVYSPKYDSSNPDLFVVRSEGDLVPSPVPQIEGLFQYTGQTYNLFSSAFGRDSFDGMGATMRTVYLVNSICPNAYWDGASTNYCPEIDGDDVVAHEWGHAYTQFTHDLVYSFQSGALNESYSDIWGETVDLLNGADGDGGTANDKPGPDGVRWKIGEDVAGLGPLRDMWTPPNNANPDKVSAAEYQCAPTDGGGVHTNSGVPNHAYAMLVDGKTFNGQTVTGIGFVKAAHIYFRAMKVYQHSTTNFPHHAQSLMAACNDLATAGTNLNGLSTTSLSGAPSGETITASDCNQVANAIAAVEMTTPPTQCNFGPLLNPNTPPDCQGPSDVFTENWESGEDGWTKISEGEFAGWPNYNFVLDDTLPAGRPGTAMYAKGTGGGVCGDPNGDYSGVFSMTSPTITAGAGDTDLQLSFDHFVATEFLVDGGNVLISVNGGAFALIPQSSYTFNPPPSRLRDAPPTDQNTNPKAGQYAWSGADPEVPAFGTTKVDLSGLVQPGDTFQLRWEFGLDGCGGNQGWYVDNIRVFNCPILTPPTLSIGAGYENPDTDGSFQLTWTRPAGATGPDTLQESTTSCGPLIFENAEAGLTQWNVSTEGSYNGLNWESSLEKPMHDSRTLRTRPAEGDVNASAILTYKTPIAIPAGGTSTLTFQDWYMGESDDGVVVEVSEDGTNWTAVYTDLRSDLAPVAAELFATEGLFSREVDLTAFKGKTIQLRFRNFVGDGNKAGSSPFGWFVDNITLINDNWTNVLADTSATSAQVSARPGGSYCYRVNTSYTLGSVIARSDFSNIVNVEVAPGVIITRLQNISARARVQTDDNVLIGGFVITDAPKRVVVRAIGPSMQAGGSVIPGRLSDTTLDLYAQGNPAPIASNDDWQTNQAEIEATNLAPTDPRESAIVMTLNPGSYTAIVRGKNKEVGLGLVEIYDVNMSAGSTLRNLSSRAFVETDDNVLIGGMIAGPNNSGPTRVVFRAIGPSLKAQLPNALDDTTLEVRDANGNPVTNDDWQQSPDAAEIQQAGLAPMHPAESAVLVSSLAPGPHTAIVRGKGNQHGVGLVEIYNLE